MIVQSKFKPAWWLRNSHAQTVFAPLFRKRKAPIDKEERVELPDGDFIDLAWSTQGLGSETPLIVLLHGLGGNVNSAYVAGLLKAFNQKKWRSVFMHFRGASEEPNRLPRVYHSGDTGDFDYLIRLLHDREPQCAIGVVGISMGGNVILKWLGENKSNALIQGAVAVSVPFELREVANRISEGFSKVYQKSLINSLQNVLRRKLLKPGNDFPYSQTKIDSCNCFWTFDDQITAPLHGFPHVHAYYREASCKPYLSKIAKPTLIIHAKDDPFMSKNVIPTEQELSDTVTLELSAKGGHVGFITGNIPGKPVYWLDERIPQFFDTIFT